jgi:hypothetical protein
MNGRYNVSKARPKDLFDAMLAHTATAGPRRRHVVPRPGETDPRFGPMEETASGEGYQRRPKPTATATLGIEPEAHMAEGKNAPRIKAKRVRKRRQEMGEED